MSASDYSEFLAGKRIEAPVVGFDVAPEDINPALFPFQRDIVRWALKLGRAALFENVGLGKTIQQLEWAKHVAAHTGKPVLIIAPLGVAAQTVAEGAKFGYTVRRVFEQAEIGAASLVSADSDLFITNYDRVHLFTPSVFGGVVLDESSILKHYSKTFFRMVSLFEDIPFRLCCTATPAPNDWVEIGNHAMFLGIMHFKDMLARWFVGEGDIARKARLKHFAREDFWRWLTSWAVCITRPADLGEEYDMTGYDLPTLRLHEHRLPMSEASIERAQASGRLMPDDSPSATEFQKVKRESMAARMEKVREIVEAIPDDEQVILWCDTDFEADALLELFPTAVEVRGSQSTKVKEDRLWAFTSGAARIIITKPQIAGFGLNWQDKHHAIFAGVSYSFERTYQALGRMHRYGQTRETHAHFIYAETEGNVMQMLDSKRLGFEEMQAEMREALCTHGLFREGSNQTTFSKAGFEIEQGANWTYYLGDCVPVTKTLPDNSVHLGIHSPPFAQLYIYSDSEADMGNAADKDEFFTHYNFLIEEMLRVTVPGRCCAVHVKDLPLFGNRDGVMGIDPFSDEVTAAFLRARLSSERDLPDAEQTRWVLQSRVTVEKDPVVEMQKSNSDGLLYKNWLERAERLRVGLPDYVLIFYKHAPGEEGVNVKHDTLDKETYYGDNPPAHYRYPSLPSRKNGRINAALPIWQEYANPNWSDVVVPLVWTDIRMTNVLNHMIAKSDKDERHICPLQLDLIGRLIHWKSNPGEVIFDPFGGIASTGYQAIKQGRKFWGVELKPEYHRIGTKYLTDAEVLMSQRTLFDLLDEAQAALPEGAG